jgi:DNA adenine methylase
MIGPLSYIGGKRAIANQIIEIFPEHTTYVEAFAGGAQVLFRKEPSKVEVLNDLDGEVVNFFRVCQQHYEELIRYFRFVLVSRKWFELLKTTDQTMLTDIQRAARFFYLQKNSFAALVRRHNFGGSVVEPSGFNPERIPQWIENAYHRLARVRIESLPYEQILERYDRPTTLFYLDPPYFGRKLYNYNFEPEDFAKLAERLKALQGKFVLSLNDVQEANSNARYQSQHYNPKSSGSNLARSILIDPTKVSVAGVNELNICDWIKRNTDRVNFLIPADSPKYTRELLEKLLHSRWLPMFEGRDY